jgi:hypothetical protein
MISNGRGTGILTQNEGLEDLCFILLDYTPMAERVGFEPTNGFIH